MSKAVSPTSHPLDRMLALSDLITHQRLTRVYTRIFEQEDPTIDDIATGLDSATTTVYEDVNRLNELDLVECVSDTQPHQYRAVPVSITVQTETEDYELTPALIVALGKSTQNDIIGHYVERHGTGGLATAFEYARAYRKGRMTSRIMAREQDITVLEAETILQELRDLLQEVEPDVDTDLDFGALDAAVDERLSE